MFYFCYLFEEYFESIAVAIEFFQKNNQNFVTAEIIGHPLTVTRVDRVIPYHFINNMELKLLCNKQKITVDLLSHIGLNVNDNNDINFLESEFYKSIFAPVKVKKKVDCQLEKIKKIYIQFYHKRLRETLKFKTYSLKL